MKHLNKIATVFCGAALGLLALTGCEGNDLYEVGSPDWIAEKVDSIEKASDGESGQYIIGETDYSSGWWTAFSEYYQIKDGEVWNAVFDLHMNSSDNTYYKNFALVITSDADRSGDGYAEYGAIRFDATPDSASYNSQWGTYLYFQYSSSNLLLEPVNNLDANVQKLGGEVTLTVDRSNADAFVVTMTNGTVTKTYNQPYKLRNINKDASNTNIRCFLVPEGSYITFKSSNIDPYDESKIADSDPTAMVLNNVPTTVSKGTSLEDAMSEVTATVTFGSGLTKTVPASALYFTAVPDMEQPGEKSLVVIYNKTYKGENAETPVTAQATFTLVEEIKELEVTQAPTRTTYYYYTSDATKGMTERTMAFDPTGLEVTATYADGSKAVIDNSELTFSTVDVTTAGRKRVTITAVNGTYVNQAVQVEESEVTKVTPTPTSLGAEDCSAAWWTVFTEDIVVPAGATYQVDFTNYSSGAGNWNNYVIILRNAATAEYGVVRADNYGWGNGYAAATLSGGQADWASWLAAMNGAECTAYVTNCNNGTCDVQVIMNGTDGETYIQYYLGLNTVDPNDFQFAFTCDGSHLVFK